MKEATQRNPDINRIIKRAVSEAVAEAVRAGYRQAEQRPKDIYRATERRLYAYPDLKERVERDKQYLRDLLTEGAPCRSKDIARFQRSGRRLSDEELVEGLVKDVQASIAADEFEIQAMENALAPLTSDPYYLVISGRYFDRLTDEQIADKIPCDPRTVRRNRGSLISRLAVRLFGAEAL